MHTRTIATQTHGRYLVKGNPGAPMLVGFHGYMEHAALHLDMLRKVADRRDWLLVSVQGLHRFYARAHTTVVANWMTTEDRDEAIADNVAYVAAVVRAVRAEFAASGPLVFAGFSQGVAMAYRAAAFAVPCNGLVLLGGDLPPDVAPVASSLPRVLLGRGTTDHWYTEPKAARDLAVLNGAGVRLETCVFEGGHEWHPAFVERAGAFLDATISAQRP